VRRSFQDEICLADVWRGRHEAGRTVNFVTVLWPHPYPAANALPDLPGPEVEILLSEPAGRGIAVTLAWQGETRLLATLNDLTAPWLQEEVRPRYAFEQGKTAYGALVTDAAFGYLRARPSPPASLPPSQQEPVLTLSKEAWGGGLTGPTGVDWAGFINGTRLDCAGRTLHAAPLHAMFQEDRTDLPGAPARFRWESDRPSALKRA
jgi:hypothetical protein